MSPKAASGAESSGAAEQRRRLRNTWRSCRSRGWLTTTRGQLTGGSGPVDGAGHEAPLVTSVAGRPDGRRPSSGSATHVWRRRRTSGTADNCSRLKTVRPRHRRTELGLVLGVVVNVSSDDGWLDKRQCSSGWRARKRSAIVNGLNTQTAFKRQYDCTL